MFVPPLAGLGLGVQRTLQQLREAAQAKHLAHITYSDATNQPSERTVRPLGVFYWGAVLTLAAWCELKDDFRSFRIDRVATLNVLEHRFIDEDGKTLADLLRNLPCQQSTACLFAID